MAETRQRLSALDAAGMMVGVVVGTGIFLAPATVAAACPSPALLSAAWAAGGILSILGVLCYAEMATAFPDRGGDYHYLDLAFGRSVAFLYGWSRMSIIQSGTIASMAFAFGDYAGRLLPQHPRAPPILAALAIATLTFIHARGLRAGTRVQNMLTLLKLGGLVVIIAAGLTLANPAPPTPPARDTPITFTGIGLAMMFVMFTFSGWNEAAFVSGEMVNLRRDFLRATIGGMVVVTLLYLGVNAAFLHGLGLEALGHSRVVAADFMHRAWGRHGSVFIAILIAGSALGACSSAIFTGARTNFALGRDYRIFRFMGQVRGRNGNPLPALWVQAAIALALVGLGAWTRGGFVTMVEYTSPAFWTFLFFAGCAFFVLRHRAPDQQHPYRVPLYPLLPVIFCLASAAMAWASIRYALTLEGLGARMGMLVLLAGLPLGWWNSKTAATPGEARA